MEKFNEEIHKLAVADGYDTSLMQPDEGLLHFHLNTTIVLVDEHGTPYDHWHDGVTFPATDLEGLTDEQIVEKAKEVYNSVLAKAPSA